jgi:hypothetical protein
LVFGCATDALGGHAVNVGGSVSVLLHLVEEALDEGRLAGKVEVVETGARSIVRDTNELVVFVQQHRPPSATPKQDRH